MRWRTCGLATASLALALGGCLDDDLSGRTFSHAAVPGTVGDVVLADAVADGAALPADADADTDADAGADAVAQPADGDVGEVALADIATDPCAGKACSDDNACTTDDCDPKLGCVHAKLPDQSPCGNQVCEGLVLHGPRVCLQGFCALAIQVTCDDGNPCTQSQCDPVKGCSQFAGTAPCDDGNACTAGDACNGGGCAGGAAVPCDDGNNCSVDLCDPGKGCQHTAATEGASCAAAACQGLTWSGSSTCQAGDCVAVEAPHGCDDGDVCTADACVAALGCKHTFVSAACDDGNGCTQGDACLGGACAPGKATPCSDDKPCTDDACDPIAGCVHTANSAPCSDASVCTQGDACAGGSCKGGTEVDCDDDNPCTSDKCGAVVGCAHAATAGPCDDGNACTQGDACAQGSCKGLGGLNCDDGKPCTVDTCDLVGGCQHATAPDGTNCSAPGCSGGTFQAAAVCAAGTCGVAPAPAPCDDGKVCTQDLCNVTQGCVHADAAGACDDGDTCSQGDACSGGKCSGQTVVCDDGNPCTADVCVKGTGCTHGAISGPCSDGNACTQGDACGGGQCAGTPMGPAACNDGAVCTDDGCDASKGCTHLAKPGACDDNNVCSTGDACASGACMPGAPVSCDDKNPCSNDACDPGAGCVHASATGSCDDGNACTQGDVCASGACKQGASISCDDKNGCTNDTCDAAKGCAHAASAASCDDGNLCTIGDACSGGGCKGGNLVACADGNPCTTDGCDAGSGCTNTANAATCNDGNPCTTGEVCSGGTCKDTGGPKCDDGNTCTTDTCQPSVGCTHLAAAGPCDDGDACTSGDSCANAACSATGATQCDDKNPCTDDSCVASAGCTHAANLVGCEDGSACTVADACAAGKCTPGKDKLFTQTYAGSGDDAAYGLVASSDGGFLWVGRTAVGGAAVGGGWLGTTAALSPNQTQVLNKTYAAAGDATLYGAAALPGGGAVAVGVRPGGNPGTSNGWLLTTDASGGKQLDLSLGGDDDDEARAVVAQADGYVFTGTTVKGNPRLWLVKVDTLGVPVFNKNYDLGVSSDVRGMAIDVATDGSLCLAATARPLGKWSSSDVYVVKTDKNGVKLWDSLVLLIGDDAAGGVVALPGDGCIVAGTTHSKGSADLLLARVDSSAVGWTSIAGDATLDDGANALLRFADGSLAVAGFANAKSSGKIKSSDVYLDRRDALGNVLWTRKFTLAGSASAMVALADQSFVLAGTTGSGAVGDTDAILIRTDPWGRASCASAGTCGVAPPATCDDGNACTADTCEASSAGCVHVPLADGAKCNTAGLACKSGVCGG